MGLRIIVKYVDFHPDNHQDGCGKSFEFREIVEVPNDTPASQIGDFVVGEVTKVAKSRRPFDPYDRPIAIQEMRIL